jgi:cysteinyl-tRNA synthetase
MSMKYLGETIDIHTGGVDLAFPHHENEIAQSEAATGKQFVKIWLHAEHLMVEGEKMSKSTGNYYTLRDLFAKGHRPSSIRFLLLSVPYRRQLNFTMDGLQQAASSVERLRNFKARVEAGRFPAGDAPEIAARIQAREDEFDEGLSDDLNTAQALAAVFDLVRDINTAIDRGEFRQSNAPIVLAALRKFDEILAVLEDNDDAKLQALGFAQKRSGVSDAEIEALVNERQEVRRARNFKRGDEIRAQLAASGIILEDMKDGSIRWKRE